MLFIYLLAQTDPLNNVFIISMATSIWAIQLKYFSTMRFIIGNNVDVHIVENPLGPIYASYTHSDFDYIGCDLMSRYRE